MRMTSTSDGASVPGKEAAADAPAPARPLEVEVEVEVDPILARKSASPVIWTSFGEFHVHTSWEHCRLPRYVIRLHTRLFRRTR
jgi:hypothetical protein